MSKEDRDKVIKNLGRSLLDELENLFGRTGTNGWAFWMVYSKYWGTVLE